MHNSSQKEIKVVYEDAEILVLDKPSGILVIPDFKNKGPTLSGLINKKLREENIEYHVYPCHRLDRETSGLIIFAKGKKNQKNVMQEFKKRQVKKRYIALVQGKLKNQEGTIKSYISSSFQRGNKIFRKNPKLAVTKYRLIKVAEDFSLVEAFPITGRTNQIRIHFQKIGHPILGERKYAFGKDFALKFRRLALHASNIEFFNPVTHKKISLSSDLAHDMNNFIASRLGDLKLNNN